MKRRKFWVGAVFFLTSCLLLTGFIGWLKLSPQPTEAPEAEAVLRAQAGLPFQILIPAYLPAGFKREAVQIDTSTPGPEEQEMVRLVYKHPIGVNFVLYEWLSEGVIIVEETDGANSVQPCDCLCEENTCDINSLMTDIGNLHIMGQTTDPTLLSRLHVETILATLGPAGGLITYTSLDQAVDSIEIPPAVEAKINDSREQEIFLVVSPTTYTPVHFSVKKGMPVRLVFRQLGEVGCGNELYLPWSKSETAHLVLSNPNDTQTLLFTPEEAGDFLFHCGFYHYQGIMTVIE